MIHVENCGGGKRERRRRRREGTNEMSQHGSVVIFTLVDNGDLCFVASHPVFVPYQNVQQIDG